MSGSVENSEQSLNDWYNENIRHCRIGKVSWKPPKHWLDRSIKRPQPLIPWTPSMEVPQPVWDWRPNTAGHIAWWQNPVVRTY
ncbi:hypothetical protein [Sinorhizobium medicae]|uniref:hypothetical protein n=1 Tax=Sinorhizobium medicae TaxID=110321 RepID=UPI001AAECAE4|nr:hypothetical protein [Sinorhizobium medicae]MBO1959480.1 hypothetical protein [Sinorhizobium medicae]WQP37577.1 hypothetical protein U8C38_16725 [Sinorhizobium medicae]